VAKPREALRVLVVDDSAVTRQVLVTLLRERGMRVEAAADPLIALTKMAHTPPDVIVLDLEMPRMDGLSFLRRLRAERPTPVVICSGVAERGTEAALRALEEGALEIISKPRVGLRSFLVESATRLIDAVEAAAAARPRRAPRAPSPLPGTRADLGRLGLIVLGASTGGTDALAHVVAELPADAPPVAIVQHMPEVFTAAFATRLDRLGRVRVKEAASGDQLARGRVLIAPGNRHLRIVRGAAGYVAEVTGGPLVSRHRPSVDELFHSVAAAAGRHGVAALMTGMGDDGARGLLAMRRAGARTLAQDEASSVVYGMPRAAVELGAAERVVPLHELTAALLGRS